MIIHKANIEELYKKRREILREMEIQKVVVSQIEERLEKLYKEERKAKYYNSLD